MIVVDLAFTIDDAKRELAELPAAWSERAKGWARVHLREAIGEIPDGPRERFDWGRSAIAELRHALDVPMQAGPYTSSELLVGGMVCDLLADHARAMLGLASGST